MALSVPWPGGRVKGPFGGAALKVLKGRIMKITSNKAYCFSRQRTGQALSPIVVEIINLVTAILQLVTAVILLHQKKH